MIVLVTNLVGFDLDKKDIFKKQRRSAAAGNH